LTQLILDLGGRTQKKCKECGMEYVPSNSEDVAAHKKFHRTSIEGVDLGKLFLSRLGEKNKMWTGDDGALIAVVTRQDPLYMRIKAKAVLDVVNEELGAAPMTDEEVWDQVVTGNADDSPYTREHRNKIYLYIDGSKCVGALLGQRLVEAHRIITEEPPRDEQPSDMPWARPPVARIPADTESQAPPTFLGISRVWTAKNHRRRNIAHTLCHTATKTFFLGQPLPKDSVAFSQPTNLGRKLAAKF
ncbi:hypothetical protein K490DRAFT_11593, partial [Saccharata proteae CBS 121410]